MHSAAPNGSWCGDQRQLSAANGSLNYEKATEIFERIGTTIEDMTTAFIKFCAMSENLPLLKAYFGIENAPAEAGARMELHHGVFKKVFDIATENSR